MKKIITLSVMKNLLLLAIMLLCLPLSAQDNYNEKMQRTQWFRDARFGMFIHFGAYAVPARGEWVKSTEKLTTEQYQKYVDAFNPYAFDAKEWARIAKKAGMKYAVLTAKHHDGFCMFDSKLTDYKIGNNFNGRDVVREFLDAFRAEGIKVGLYYSLIDWNHPDYPNVGNHPQRDDKEYAKKKFNWDNYLKYMHGQVEELSKNYGKIDIMWFDYSFDDYSGEKWKAKELVAMLNKNQPGIILDNRLEVNQGITPKGRELSPYGDIETPEQAIPDKGIVHVSGKPLTWETCLTLNNNWGYTENDNNWKSPTLIIQSLVNCVSKDGNLLLNVGPDATGRIPAKSVEILGEVGKWMSLNSESIYGCGSSTIEKPEWGRITQKGNIIYAHWMYPIIGHINVPGLADKVKSVTLLSTGAELSTSSSWWGNSGSGNFFINVNSPTHATFELPDKSDTVIKIELK